jgi:uncharacterized Tic20 family protein
VSFMGNNDFIKEMQPPPGHRERMPAVLAHGSIVTYLLGIFTGPLWPLCIFPFIPMIILVIYRRKDKWVAFHAWQAILFQLILFFDFFFIGFPAFILVFSKCGPGFGQNFSGCKHLFLPFTLLAILGLFVIPLGMVVFGFVRGVFIIGGNDIEYPLITRLLRKWLKPEQ